MDLLPYYIRACTNNIFTGNKCIDIDLIISGGAFNGAYGFGIIMYLKQLEKEKKIKINKISGSSVGALLGFILICDITDKLKMEKLYLKLQKNLKEEGNLKNMKIMIKKIVNLIIKNKEDISKLNNRLYINKTNIKDNKDIVISSYNSNKEIIDNLTASCFIPYLTDGKKRFKNKYIDGLYPYIFKNKNKIIFINIHTFRKLKKMIVTSNEESAMTRIIEGILDINLFLTQRKSIMCSWINDWKILDFLIYRISQAIIKIFFMVLDKIDIEALPIPIKNNFFIKIVLNSVNLWMKDILYVIS